MQKLKNEVLKILKEDLRIWNEDKTELNQTLLFDLLDNVDSKIIELLLKEKETRDKFFIKIKDAHIFKTNDFRFFMEENKVDNSYTQYKNQIGLTDGKRFLKDTEDVVLNWPFKDCVLEGGMTKEDEKNRNEIFFNEILAKDEQDRLLDEKALVNWKRYTKKGEEKVGKIKRDNDGTIKENLIIKGNNLLALHSLEKQFVGKIKLIYIDPPYNINTKDFGYNDRFNHSTWLTFIKNRLEVAKKLLSEDGAIFIQIDHHELGYLTVLMDEIFDPENKVQIITTKVSAASGFKAVNPGPIDVTEFILFYTKNKNRFVFQKNYIETGYHKNYNLYLDKSKEIRDWKLTPLKEKVLRLNGFSNQKDFKKKFGDISDIILERWITEFAFNNSENVVSIRDLHKPSDILKKIQEESKREREKIFLYKKQDGSFSYLINGGVLAFYSTKIREIDGKKRVTELLTNFWNHISWAGIAKEGGVTLKNGKKPEKLLKQIFEIAGVKPGDFVLDFFLGSGTTCAVAHKMNLNYIGLEQLDYGDNDAITRLKNVIEGDESGISDVVNWKDGGAFIYCELAKYNEEAKEKILTCKNFKELEKLFDELYEKYFLNYNVRVEEFKKKILKEENFKHLSLDKQKELFLEMLDLNQLYVQKSEMEDKQFKISEEDQELTREFYKGEE